MATFKKRTAVCARCGKLFDYMGFGFRYCPICKVFDEEEFSLVREYVYEHGTATMLEVEQQTGVSNRRIMQYLREGRLEIPESSPIFIRCDGCNTEIRSGRFCKACGSKLSKELTGVLTNEYEIGEEPKDRKGKMRFNRERD